MAAPARFTVEEKNRIRRNLEGYKPLTVSKAKSDSEEFFKLIMGFGAPKPRNIEKDVKVFPWKILGPALKKIISKYSASPSSTTMPPSTPHLLTPVSVSPSYHALPPTPGSATTATDPSTTAGYLGAANHASESVASPRGLTGPVSTSSSWGAYPAPTRMMSPTLKTNSEILGGGGPRMSAMPSIYDTRQGSHPSVSSQYGLSSQSHHHQPAHGYHHASAAPSVPVTHGSRRWDNYTLPSDGAVYGGGHHPHGQSQVYSSAAYGDGVQRA